MQKLPDALRERLDKEFHFAAAGMASAPDIQQRIYFFSVFYGEINRVLNQWWSPELALAHSVLKDTTEQISGRVNAPIVGTPNAGIPQEFSAALDQLANDLAELFAAPEVEEAKLYLALARAAELGYVVTGNGYYLYLKGAIKV
jgi:hypothetical protein